MPRNTLEYSTQEETQYNPEDFRDWKLDPRADNDMLLEAYLDTRETPGQYGKDGTDQWRGLGRSLRETWNREDFREKLPENEDESREDPARAGPARALEFTKDLSLSHRETIMETGEVISKLTQRGQNEYRDLTDEEQLSDSIREDKMYQFTQNHPDDWQERLITTCNAAEVMLENGEHLTGLGFLREDENAIEAGRKLMQEATRMVVDIEFNDETTSHLMRAGDLTTWAGARHDTLETAGGIIEQMEWMLDRGEVPEQYRQDVWSMMAKSMTEDLQDGYRKHQDFMLWETDSKGGGFANILSHADDHIGADIAEAFLQAQGGVQRHDPEQAAFYLGFPRGYQEASVGVTFALSECQDGLPDERREAMSESHSHTRAILDSQEGCKERAREHLESILEHMPERDGDNDHGQFFNRTVEDILREKCLEAAGEAIELLENAPENKSASDLYNQTYWGMRNAAELAVMLNNGGVERYVAIAKASPDWEDFITGTLYLDNN